jgi:hypothetical protein
MLRFLVPAAAVALLSVAPALAQPPFKSSTVGPTPGEQNSMHTGTTASNGSSTIVTDENGTHPETYPGFAVVNSASGSSAAAMHRHHRHHRHAAVSEPSAR